MPKMSQGVAHSTANISARNGIDASPGPKWLRPFLEGATSELALLAARGDGLWRAIEASRVELGAERDREARIVESHREHGATTPASALTETHRAQAALRQRNVEGNAAATSNNNRKSVVTDYITQARKYAVFVAASGEPVTPAKIALPEGMHPLDVISQAQAQEAELRAERGRIAAAEPPLEEAITTALGLLREFERPLVTAKMHSGKVSIYWPVVEVGAEARGNAVPNAPDARAIALAINRPAVEKAVRDSLTAQYRDIALKMPTHAKRAKLIEIDEAIIECQMVECAAIYAARAQGIDVEMRAGLDIRSVLLVEGPPPPRERKGY